MNKKFLFNLLIFCILFILCDLGLFFVLKKGLDRYYGFGKESEILIVGSSASLSGYNISTLESVLHKKASLYAQEGSSLDVRYTMLDHFLDKNAGATRMVLYEISPRNFFDRGLAANAYKMFYPYMEDTIMGRYIISEETKMSSYKIHKYVKTSRFNNRLLKYSFQGYLGINKNVKNLTVDTITIADFDLKKEPERIVLDSAKIMMLEQSIKIINDYNAYVVLVNFPITEFLQKSYSKDDYDQYITLLQNIDNKSSRVSFIDLNVQEYRDYQLFSDKGHLNTKGQKVFTEKICSELKSLNY